MFSITACVDLFLNLENKVIWLITKSHLTDQEMWLWFVAWMVVVMTMAFVLTCILEIPMAIMTWARTKQSGEHEE